MPLCGHQPCTLQAKCKSWESNYLLSCAHIVFFSHSSFYKEMQACVSSCPCSCTCPDTCDGFPDASLPNNSGKSIEEKWLFCCGLPFAVAALPGAYEPYVLSPQQTNFVNWIWCWFVSRCVWCCRAPSRDTEGTLSYHGLASKCNKSQALLWMLHCSC